MDTTEQVTLSLHFQTKYDFPSGTTVENPLANAEDAGGMGSIPGSGKAGLITSGCSEENPPHASLLASMGYQECP